MIRQLIQRNIEDIEEIGKFVKKLDKLKSKEIAGRIQNLLIKEVIRLSYQNKELQEFLRTEISSQ